MTGRRLTIGEAAAASGGSAKMIRYYEGIGLIAPATRTASGYRSYGEREVHVLRFIRRARDLGFSVEGIAELLSLWTDRGRPSREVRRLAEAQIGRLEARIAELEAMRDTLGRLVACCAGDDRPDCPILADLEAGAPTDARPGGGGPQRIGL